MNFWRKKVVLLIVVIIIIGLLFLFGVSTKVVDLQEINENIRKGLYGNPIDQETGMINNKYFGINLEGKEAQKTTQGINEAIEYANNHNIMYLKLEKGEYLVNGEGERTEEKGIVLKSNIHLDLNNSTIVHETNGSIRYSIFAIYNVENITISNGILIGDKDTHKYEEIDSTHEWGFGVEIQGSKNIKIYNLEIKNLTGDGIVVTRFNINKKSIPSQYIQISGNQIYGCRRQGITIGHAKDVKIYQNEIYNISGTSPASAIDIEPDYQTELAENIEIYNNKLYSVHNRLNVVRMIKHIKNVNLYDNEINGNVVVYGSKDKITIKNNKISNGNINFKIEEKCRDNPDFMNKIEMKENSINNCDFHIEYVNNILVSDNDIQKTGIYITSSNVAIANNIFSNLKNNEYIKSFDTTEGNNQKYTLYLYQNILPENTKEISVENEYLYIFYDEDNFEEYKMKEFGNE